MLFQISEKILRVLKAIKEPRSAVSDIAKPAHKSPIVRGRHEIRYDLCTGCGACDKICPVNAIKMKKLPIKRPSMIPEVNLGVCIFCGLCEDVCPVKPQKAIHLSGGDAEMLTDGTNEALDNFWVRVDIPEEWIKSKKREEEEKARKKAEMLAKKKAEAEAKKKADNNINNVETDKKPVKKDEGETK